MPDLRVAGFTKGWIRGHRAIIGIDVFDDVSNFKMREGNIEKVLGWSFLLLTPKDFGDTIDGFSIVIDDVVTIIDET